MSKTNCTIATKDKETVLSNKVHPAFSGEVELSELPAPSISFSNFSAYKTQNDTKMTTSDSRTRNLKPYS